jgi:hypothetical protein
LKIAGPEGVQDPEFEPAGARAAIVNSLPRKIAYFRCSPTDMFGDTVAAAPAIRGFDDAAG